MILNIIGICLCAFIFVMVYIDHRWVEVPFDYFGCLSNDVDYRSPDGKPIDSSLCWYSLSERPFSERGPDKNMYEKFEFDFDNYSYIVCQGYKLKSFKYRQPLFGKKWNGYVFREGFAILTMDGLPNTAYVYCIPKMWVEPKWNIDTIESDSMILEGRIGTQITNLDRLHVTVWEADSFAGEAAVLWEKTYEPFSENQAAFGEMEAHLWDGLRKQEMKCE